MILNSRLVSGGDIDRGYVYTLNNISLKIDVWNENLNPYTNSNLQTNVSSIENDF